MNRLVLTVFLSATVIAVSAPITTALVFPVLEGEGWDGPGLGRADLTFHFGTPIPDLTLDAQRATFTAALNVWASVAAVSFTETARAGLPSSIDVNFLKEPPESSHLRQVRRRLSSRMQATSSSITPRGRSATTGDPPLSTSCTSLCMNSDIRWASSTRANQER
jgi:hypothetical protein